MFKFARGTFASSMSKEEAWAEDLGSRTGSHLGMGRVCVSF